MEAKKFLMGCPKCGEEISGDDAFLSGEQAGMRKVVETLQTELEESDSQNMYYLNKNFWRAFLKDNGLGG